MKKFKKLIPALCMLLVSAILLGGSTYAWFSMNDTVSANGMTVEAVANTKFLVISTDSANLGTSASTTVTKENGYGIEAATGGTYTDTVYPSAFNNNATEIKVKQGDGEVGVAAYNWYTAFSSTYSSSNGQITDAHSKVVSLGASSSDTLKPYVLKYVMYIGLAEGSGTVTGKITAKPTFTLKAGTTGTISGAVKALVEISTGEATDPQRAVLTTADQTSGHQFANDITLTAKEGTAAAKYATVTVYMFVDGTHEDVKDLTSANLAGNLTIDFTMSNIAN